MEVINACSHRVRGHGDDEAASYTHHIGETPYTIKTNTKGSSVALVKLHDDETTAEKAASEVLGSYDGSFLTVETAGKGCLPLSLAERPTALIQTGCSPTKGSGIHSTFIARTAERLCLRSATLLLLL